MASACVSPADAGVPPGRTVDSALIDAALVIPQFGWVLTADQVLLTRDGGRTFTAGAGEAAVRLARTAYFRGASQGWVAATDGATISVAHTADGGATWTNAAASRRPSRSAGCRSASARRPTAPSWPRSRPARRSPRRTFRSADGGATWQEKSAPVAGQVSVEPGGRLWLAGGVLGNEFYTSSDHGTKWTRP